jgi:hypothetical protein
LKSMDIQKVVRSANTSSSIRSHGQERDTASFVAKGS